MTIKSFFIAGGRVAIDAVEEELEHEKVFAFWIYLQALRILSQLS